MPRSSAPSSQRKAAKTKAQNPADNSPSIILWRFFGTGQTGKTRLHVIAKMKCGDETLRQV
ncbi:uncharacterized protein N7500_001614 [Penicillium coprophilum]|uniref:uncharacterized protein n=1 Tax=Penicillium coprophilum TaxID=36646 RepID=UPI00238E6A0A|nr:uncharacterized protein N7500_001614 [Penicillium coprophilum]KAJ5173683.1 hypothetical protein N7500_001614 [Penicillium coprophilum]